MINYTALRAERCLTGFINQVAFGIEPGRGTPEQLRWVNRDAMLAALHAGSVNTRLRCGVCDCYVGEDATATTGLLAVPLASMRLPPAACLPNMHIFYARCVLRQGGYIG